MISYCKLLRLPEFQALKFTFPTLLTAITDLLQKIIYILRITGELCENSSKLLKLSCRSSFTYCTNILLITVLIYYYCRKNMIRFDLIWSPIYRVESFYSRSVLFDCILLSKHLNFYFYLRCAASCLLGGMRAILIYWVVRQRARTWLQRIFLFGVFLLFL